MISDNFAFLNPLFEAVAWVLINIHAGLGAIFGPNSGASWALSIILLTALMKLLVVPLFIKQMKSQRKMAVLAPQVAALKKKYKNDKQTMNQEVMKLYQENGANPLMGCLPMIVQLPVWWALFDVLDAVASGHAKYGFTPALVHSALNAQIFGATISTRIFTTYLPPYHFAPGPLTGKIVVIVAVLISATMTYLTTHQMMKRGIGQMTTDPDAPGASMQKYMKYVSPLFALSGAAWPFGVVIYWVISYTWQFGQTSILYRRYVTPVTEGEVGAEGPGAKAEPAMAQGFVKGTVQARDAAAKGTVSRSTAAKTVTQRRPAARGAASGRTGTGTGVAGGNGARAGAKSPARPGSAGGTVPARGPARSAPAKPAKPGDADDAATAARPGARQVPAGRARAKAAPPAGAAGPSGPATGAKPAGSGANGSGAFDGASGPGGTRISKPPRTAGGGKAQRPGRPQGTQKPAGEGANGKLATGQRQRAAGASDGSNGSGGSGKRGLSRLIRGRPEPEPEPEAAAPKLVRQQRVHQSRSKRSGKR